MKSALIFFRNLTSNFDGEYYLLFYLDEIDLFGDGDYSLRIKNSRETKEKYLTDEEKALLGIE